MSIEEGAVIRRPSVEDVDVFRRIRLEALSHEPPSFASGRTTTLVASTIGLSVAIAVALGAAPSEFRPSDAALALLRGAWIGWIVVPYILGGLLFWLLVGSLLVAFKVL